MRPVRLGEGVELWVSDLRRGCAFRRQEALVADACLVNEETASALGLPPLIEKLKSACVTAEARVTVAKLARAPPVSPELAARSGAAADRVGAHRQFVCIQVALLENTPLNLAEVLPETTKFKRPAELRAFVDSLCVAARFRRESLRDALQYRVAGRVFWVEEGSPAKLALHLLMAQAALSTAPHRVYGFTQIQIVRGKRQVASATEDLDPEARVLLVPLDPEGAQEARRVAGENARVWVVVKTIQG